MRWERLFDDLEAQLEAEAVLELDAASRSRRGSLLAGRSLHGRCRD